MRRRLPYTVRFNPSNQEIELAGTIRPEREADFDAVASRIRQSAGALSGTFYLNLRRLRHLNHTGFVALARCLQALRGARPELALKLIISSAIPWSEARFRFLADVIDGVGVEIHDNDFYPGHSEVEDEQLIPSLRTQTSVLWKHERKLLTRHGLRPGATIADVGCNIGDFATLVHKTFKPALVVAVDHSQAFLEYARGVADEFGLRAIEYRRGDPSNLLLADDSFDFVTCRLALNMFDRPGDVLRELLRITRPGGRLYLVTEFMSQVYGYPRDATVGWTYRRAAELFAVLSTELDLGPKTRGYLANTGFTDIRIDLLEISGANTDRHDFERVRASWAAFIDREIAAAAGGDERDSERMRQGFRDHIHAITHRRGYATWPVCVASGQKPERRASPGAG
ncbi:MAG: methyltransferase domain-containing protein [Myxococcales bacterium]|nr:methyltransferase domain-containing protein [Myxococcales bacterium]MCB9749587.1 methyltransferase domain-containing protein [Myxococcales bacterium]